MGLVGLGDVRLEQGCGDLGLDDIDELKDSCARGIVDWIDINEENKMLHFQHAQEAN